MRNQGRHLSLASVLRAFLQQDAVNPITHFGFLDILTLEKLSHISGIVLGSLLTLFMALNSFLSLIFFLSQFFFLSIYFSVACIFLETILNPV